MPRIERAIIRKSFFEMKNLADSKLKFIVTLKSKSKYLSQNEKTHFRY